jgi:hypothetical protein
MLQLKLSSYEFPIYDYGNDITFKLYDEDGESFDASTYTAEVLVSTWSLGLYIDGIVPTWTTQSSGIGTFQFTETKTIDTPNIYHIEIQLTKSGVKLSTEAVKIVSKGSMD